MAASLVKKSSRTRARTRRARRCSCSSSGALSSGQSDVRTSPSRECEIICCFDYFHSNAERFARSVQLVSLLFLHQWTALFYFFFFYYLWIVLIICSARDGGGLVFGVSFVHLLSRKLTINAQKLFNVIIV